MDLHLQIPQSRGLLTFLWWTMELVFMKDPVWRFWSLWEWGMRGKWRMRRCGLTGFSLWRRLYFPEIILLLFKGHWISLPFFFYCSTVSGTFLDLPLMKLISCVQIHINTCIRHIEIERNESYGECLCIIPVIYSIASYRKA